MCSNIFSSICNILHTNLLLPLFLDISIVFQENSKYRILGKFTAYATPRFMGFVDVLNKDI
jgi:hypothetical protein